MTKNLKNLGIECPKTIQLEKEVTQLRKDNKVLGNELTYFKEYAADLEETVNALKNRCRILTSENTALKSEIQDMKFTRKYLTSEDAGKKLAQELLHADIAAEVHENEIVNAMGSYLGDDY